MRFRQALNLARQMGPGWVAYRAGYSLRRRIGLLERQFPSGEWSTFRLPDLAPGTSPDNLLGLLENELSHRFFIRPALRERYHKLLREMLPPAAISEVVGEVNRARAGGYKYFSGVELEGGWPPNWHRHPETGQDWPLSHWSRLRDLGESDVKWLWELGRFGIAYSVVRAYWLTGDAKHAEVFWELLESWRDSNPPNCGVHWMCGQECSLRVLAWCFALFGLLDAPATTPERVSLLLEMLFAHGVRIEANLGYAVSQKNNHSVNEALALWTLGVLFPMLHTAPAWERKGRELLEREARRQIYDDGAYVQHSFNYHRLILQSYAWAISLGELCGRPFSQELRDRYATSATFLYQMTDEKSGEAPNYGANDGALLFHLDACNFRDYRPSLALGHWVSRKRRVLQPGEWDEPLLWLCGEPPLEAATSTMPRTDFAAESGGYYTLRAGDTWGFTRCGVYRDRPSQADMLHIDVWWRGTNLLADPGTFSYNSPPPWKNGLSGTGSHNTVQVDRQDQMERGPRFTWFCWNNGKVIRRSSSKAGRLKFVEGQHDGYLNKLGVIHRRAIILIDERLWIIIDDLDGAGVHQLSSQWLLPSVSVEAETKQSLQLTSPAGKCSMSFFTITHDGLGTPKIEIVKGEADTTRGWFSTTYLSKEPALSVITTDDCSLPARRVMVMSLAPDAIIESVREDKIAVRSGTDSFRIDCTTLPCKPSQSLIRRIAIRGNQQTEASA